MSIVTSPPTNNSEVPAGRHVILFPLANSVPKLPDCFSCGPAVEVFCLPQAAEGGKLSAMPTASDIGLQIGPARPQAALPAVAQGPTKPHAPQGRTNSLHCNSHAWVEAVQFNSEVSAMPQNHSQHLNAHVPGTADTSLLRWAYSRG